MMKSCVHRGIGEVPQQDGHVYYGCTDALLAIISVLK